MALVFGEHESVTKRSNQNWLNGNTTDWRVGFAFCAHFPRGCEIDNNTFITIYWKCHVVISRYMHKVQPMETSTKGKSQTPNKRNSLCSVPIYDSNIKRIAHSTTNCVYLFWFRCMIKCTHLDAVNPKLTSTNVHTTTLLMTSLFWVKMILLDNFKFISKHTRNHCKCSFWMHFWNEMSDTFFEKYYFWNHYLFTIMSELYCYVAFSCSTIQKCGKTSLLLVWLLVHFIIVITCLKNTWPILKIVIFLWIS